MKNLIAACGVNCSLCMAYLREKNTCAGCNSDMSKAKHCDNCSIKYCVKLKGLLSGLCIDCEEYPCRRIGQLNKRYLKNYGVDLMANMKRLKEVGSELFLQEDMKKYTCPQCGIVVGVHHAKSSCGYVMFVRV